MPKGYQGKLLRVDLTHGKIGEESLPSEDILRKYIGGVGLACKVLFDEVPLTTQPLDPANRLILMAGPLTGTPAPGGSSTVVACLNYETGYTMGTSFTHGYFGAYLRFAGFDGIVIRGAAPHPVYLWVHDGTAELRAATEVWGKETHDTEDLIKKEIGDPLASVACIGPAAENLVHGCLVQTDKHHVAAKGGGGTVMGSKKLKAIAVSGRGSPGIPIAHPQEFLTLSEEWLHKLFRRGEGAFVERGRDPRNIGVLRQHFEGINVLGMHSATAVKNLSNPSFAMESWRAWEEGKHFHTLSKGCFGCPRSCGFRSEITSGPHKGRIVHMSGGGELYDGVWMVGVTEVGSVLWLGERFNRLGLDSTVAGACLGLAFECYERGVLTKEDTDGLELRWGNAAAAAALLEKMARREGFGRILAEGPKRAAELIGGDAPQYAVHIKGTGMNLHDWRPTWGTLLGQAIAGVGPAWQAYRLELRTEPDLGYTEPPKLFTPEGKAREVYLTQRRKLWEDSLGICWFDAARDSPGTLPLVPRVLAAATGWDDFTLDEALAVGERVVNLQRLFNLRRGFTPARDLDLSPRVLEAPADGFAQGKTIAPYLEDLVREYYSLMGWDTQTGKPLPETLRRLGLEEFSSECWGEAAAEEGAPSPELVPAPTRRRPRQRGSP